MKTMKIYKYIALLFLINLPAMGTVTYLFSHGLADTGKQADKYVKSTDQKLAKPYLIDGKLVTFNYPDAGGFLAKMFRVNFTQTSLGQGEELNALNHAYNSIDTEQNVVLIGLSRGAVAAFNFVALNKPERVKALIIESPFCAFANLAAALTARYPSCIRSMARRLVRNGWPFFKHTINGPTPKALAIEMPHSVPILIVCSDEDKTVPAQCSKDLADALIAAGHPQVYFLRVTHGAHSKILSGVDGHTYQAVTHAFYKKCNLPHLAQAAAQGAELLEQCHLLTA
jgi:dienelactone hydrolase